ncbi:MAG: hypothetical protein WC613_05855 [Candidatus Aenigmatarchaeota archaeon]
MGFQFSMVYEFEAVSIWPGMPAKYGLNHRTPSAIGGAGYMTIEEVSKKIIGMISADLQVARSEEVELPRIATVTTGGRNERLISLQEYQELQRLLNDQRKEGFPEFVFPSTPDRHAVHLF